MVVASEEEFGRLDAVAGDGDHGIGMARGITAGLASARAAVERGAGVSTVFAEAGEGWAEHAGGTSGALWGVCLTSAGAALAAEPDLRDPRASARAAAAGLEAIQRLGGAEVGDKTLVDAFVPWSRRSVAPPTRGSTCPRRGLVPRRRRAGRGRDLAPPAPTRPCPTARREEPGHPDAGAVSFARIAGVVAREIAAQDGATSADAGTATPTTNPIHQEA